MDFQVENEHLIKESLDRNKGVIVFTPHLGNVEVIVNFLGSRHSAVIPYKLSEIDYVDEFIKSSRESIGAKMVPTSISGVRTALIELRKSKLITIASDQVPINKKSGLISNFFGVPSLSTTTSKKRGIPLWSASLKPTHRYDIYTESTEGVTLP